MSDELNFYCPNCHATFELRNYSDVTGMKYSHEQQDIFCPVCGDSHCVHVAGSLWRIEYAFRRVRDAENELRDQAQELMREVNENRADVAVEEAEA